ncbi:MAG: hypothetical protein KGJ66_07210 [Alphaproteobacteria bacterium]|nr:hypothetical protein [Alphaproteobacteria bacterium]
MKFLLDRAWSFLALCLALNAFFKWWLTGSSALGPLYTVIGAVAGLVFELPVAIPVGLVVFAITRFGFRHPVTTRLTVVSLGVGYVTDIVLDYYLWFHYR